jgi:hypothetical protein
MAGAPEQHHPSAPGRTEEPASAPGTADTRATDAGEPHAGQQSLTGEQETRPEPGSPADTAAVPQAASAGNSSSPQGQADAATRLRALAGQHGLTVTADRLSPANTLITITDGDRAVLLHDDISGTKAGGIRIDLREADAYLVARRDYPGLPAGALLDWVRRSPDAPAQLSLSAARSIAEDCGLVAQPVRAAGQPFIVFREPGCSRAVLAYRPASPAASSGLVTVPVPAIGAYLRAYREAIPPRWAAVFGKRDDWASQVTALAPYLIGGTSLHSAQARRHVAAAADAAARDDHGTVKDELRRAWAAGGPFAPAPDREAALVRIISDVVPRYQQITGDGARYAAEIAGASDPEWDWIGQWTRDHPQILTATPPSPEVAKQRDADERAQGAAEGKALSEAAKAAFDAGDYPAALTLIDQGEIASPERAALWEAARDTILEKPAATQPAPRATAGQAAPAAAEAPQPQQATAATEQGAAGNDSGTASGTSPGTVGTRHPVPGDDPPSTAGLPEPAAPAAAQPGHTESAGPVTPAAAAGADGDHPSPTGGAARQPAANADGQRDQDQPAPETDATAAGTLGGQPSSPGATPGSQPQPEPPPAADPYTDPRQAQADYYKAQRDYLALCDTEAGRTLIQTLPPVILRPASNRPDAITLDAAWRAFRNTSWQAAFAGDAQEVAGRFTAWAQAASVMARNLAAEKHRARKFRQALDTFTGSATRLASRTQATARDTTAWAEVFAGIPASTQAAGPDPGKTAEPEDARPAAATATAPPRPAPAEGTGTRPGHDEPAGSGPAEPVASPLTNSDLAAELRRLPGFARWLSQAGEPPAGGDPDSQRPGAGSSAVCDERGIEITVSGPGFTRRGLVTWPQAASWIDNGVTPARLGLAVIADRLSTFCRDRRDQLIAAGTCDPDTTAAELGQIRDAAVAMIVDAALRSRGAAVPVPPARPEDPAWYTTVMTTRPARGAGKAENAALERLTQVRTLIREPQPVTAAEIRVILRRRIGYSLADLVRALDDPAAVRAWINGQASRPVPDGYDNSGEHWYGTSPDGLLTDRNGDDRAPSCVRWEDIPAWIRPGITSSLRDRLLAAADASSAVFRRAVSAAVRQDPGAVPGEEEDKQARQRLREATDAAWAAIEAAPPPSPADLDRARHDYRDWRPVQQTLFDDLPQDTTRAQDGSRTAASRPPRPAQPGPASSAGSVRPAAKAAAPQQEPAIQQHPPSPAAVPAGAGTDNQQAGRPDQRTSPEPGQPAPPPKTAPARAAGTTAQDPGTARPASAGPAHGEGPEPPPAPATNSDLAIALHSMSGQELTSFLTSGKTPDGHGSLTSRRKGLPDAGASQMLNFDRAGVRITVRSRGFHRHGQITWRQVASWIDTGLTPARLGIIIAASGLHIFTYARRDELIAAGKDNIDAAIRELNQISTDAIDSALSAALSARDADAPVPPARSGKPAYRTMAMLTGPDPSATSEENTALARIAELGAAIRGTQPVTPADIRTAIRWWIGDSLPEYARALATPEAMRAWIRRQASGPASRPGHGAYNNGRYYSAHPEGLRTSQGSDTRAAPWILWEEIPAWMQPGLSVGLRDRLAAAEPRPAPGRTRTAAARPPAGAADPAGQADDPRPGPLREAIDAAWAAIEAAPPPTPADLDHARTIYRAAGTVQQALPGGPAKTGQPGRTAAPAPRPRAEPRTAPPRPAPGTRRQDELPAAAAAGMPAGTGTSTRREPAALPQPPATPDPLTDDDIFLGISRLPAFVIGDLFRAIDTSQPLESVGRQLRPYSGERAAGEADPGARETVSAEPAGIRIQVAPAGNRRTGLITWAQIDDLLRPGLTPGRRQIAVQAWQVRVGFMAANASFRAVGEGRLAAAAEDELRVQAAAAVTAILAAAHPATGGAASPVTDEAATIERIAALAAALPSQPPRSRTPAGEVTTGDVIGHPGYRFQPFRVSAPPRQTDTAVEITGRLTEPAGTEPAGPITLTLPRAGRPGAVVSVIPVPARSLRPLFPGHDAAEGTGQPADARPDRADRAPAETAGAPSDVVPSPGTEIPASQPHAPQTPSHSQEETMPPADPVAPSGSLAFPEASAAPQPPSAAPAPAPPETGGQRDAGRDAAGIPAAARPGDGASLTDELERVLDAIRQRRGAAADGHADDDDFSDIRSAFAAMRDALGLSAASPETGPGRPAPAPAAASRPPRGEPGPAADGFTDIQAAFTDLRDILGLPARGRHARSDGHPGGTGASIADALDQAAAEAQACARWFRDTPEWQRISTVGRAARDLITAIREAAGDYWAEIRLDIRVRGFARTLAARTALAVSGAAHVLAGRLERAGHRDSRVWRAAWRLHQATTTFANRIMRYTPPGSPDRMREARRIIDDLGQRQNRPGQPGPGRHAAPRSAGAARTPNAAALASASFPVMVTRANARQATAASSARTAAPAPRQPAARRQ